MAPTRRCMGWRSGLNQRRPHNLVADRPLHEGSAKMTRRTLALIALVWLASLGVSAAIVRARLAPAAVDGCVSLPDDIMKMVQP